MYPSSEFANTTKRTRNVQRDISVSLRESTEDNIVYAYVHMETTPHMHTECNPDNYDGDKKRLACNYKSSFHAKNQTFHKDFLST